MNMSRDASSWEVKNVSMATAGTFYQIYLGSLCKGFEIKLRNGAALKISHLAAGTPYFTAENPYWSSRGMNLTGSQHSVWAASDTNTDVAEVIVYA